MSKLSYKGDWTSEKTYEVGDVVVYSDGVVYYLQRPTLTGSTPHDTRCWGRLQAPLAACVLMFHDMFSGLLSDVAETKDVVDAVIFDNKTIILDSSTEASTKKYAITVDDEDGLAATEIEEEGGES